MFTREEKILIDEYNKAEKHNHGLNTQYYIFKLYEEMKKYEAETGLVINFSIPVSKNNDYNPKSCELDNVKFNMHSKKIEVFYIDEKGEGTDHPLSYMLRDFIREDIFCYALNSDEEKEYFYKNPVLNLNNFQSMVDYMKPINHIQPDFHYISNTPQEEINKITLCDLEMPLYLTEKRKDIKKDIDEHVFALRRVVSKLNRSALLYMLDKINSNDSEFKFGFSIRKDGRNEEINAIYEINGTTGEQKQVLKDPSADYIFWQLSMYNKHFVKNERGNIDKNSLNSIVESVIKTNEVLGIMVNDSNALNIEVESKVLGSILKTSQSIKINNRARI